DPDLAEPVTATYDPDGDIATETLPIGLKASFSYDATGYLFDLSWDKTTKCSSGCLWARSQITSRDLLGRITGHHSTEADQTYTYDNFNRLIDIDDVRLSDNRCVRRHYEYDADSNRTKRAVTTSTAGAACGTGSPVNRTWTHDTADRVTTSGWTHD